MSWGIAGIADFFWIIVAEVWRATRKSKQFFYVFYSALVAVWFVQLMVFNIHFQTPSRQHQIKNNRFQFTKNAEGVEKKIWVRCCREMKIVDCIENFINIKCFRRNSFASSISFPQQKSAQQLAFTSIRWLSLRESNEQAQFYRRCF